VLLLNVLMHPVNPLSDNTPYFIILLFLTADNFTSRGESARTQWVELCVHVFFGFF
jgi:hypothetical protein